MKSEQSMKKGEKRKKNVYLLGLVSFLNDLSSEMIMPILPLFIASLGGGGFAVGVISGVRESVSSLVKIMSGYMADKTGDRKRFVFLGYLNSAVFKLLLGFSRMWQHVLIFTGLERIGKGLRTAPRDAILADSLPGQRGKGFGFHRMCDTLGAVAGAAVTLLLYWVFRFDFRAIIFIAAAFSFTSLLPVLLIKAKKAAPQSVTFSLSLRSLSGPLKAFIFIAAVFYLANFSYMFFLLRAREYFSATRTGLSANALPILLYIISNIVYASGSMPFGILSDKIGRRKVLAAGYFLFALTALGFAFYQSFSMFLVLFCLYGVVMAIVDANERAYIADLAPAHLKATALGVFHATIGFVGVLEGLIVGSLWQWISPQSAFFYGAAVTGLAGILLLVFGSYLARAE
ncbi:MAG: MFS transporter [Candidatus Omnitrophica bacterium]|nr:MFS transporter [Candidatus Omnitrophota bacterium]